MPTLHVLPTLTLDSGATLRQVPVAYQTWGTLNAARDNVVLVCHALTGDTDAASWWGPLIGPGQVLDTNRFLILCANVLGSPYGSASPLTLDPDTGAPYGPAFPRTTIRDTVRAHKALLDALGIQRVQLAIGGSMGGMQVLEWGIYGDFVRHLVPIAVGGRHSAWCIGWSEAQRQAIFADARWRGGQYPADDPPAQGLAAARMMAMVSYRTAPSFEARFGRERMAPQDATPPSFSVESYLGYQGRKLVDRFDANCYVHLTWQMDTHDVAAGRGAYPEVLGTIQQPTLVMGVNTDVLYPLHEQEELAQHLPQATLQVMDSPHGHDAFLMEFDQMIQALRAWMYTQAPALMGVDASSAVP
ncbi:MAG: homoserine O-acetyltransferase [Bacteroidota bacterium]